MIDHYIEEPNPNPVEMPYLDENEGPWTRLTVRQRMALDAILEGRDWANAAHAASVSPRTLWNWRLQPDFAACLRALDEQHFQMLHERLLSVADHAFTIIESRLMPNNPRNLQAAQIALNLVIRCQSATGTRAALREARKEVAALRARVEAMEKARAQVVTDAENRKKPEKTGTDQPSVHPVQPPTPSTPSTPSARSTSSTLSRRPKPRRPAFPPHANARRLGQTSGSAPHRKRKTGKNRKKPEAPTPSLRSTRSTRSNRSP